MVQQNSAVNYSPLPQCHNRGS